MHGKRLGAAPVVLLLTAQYAIGAVVVAEPPPSKAASNADL